MEIVENIQMVERVKHWRQAVELAIKPLVSLNLVQTKYKESILKQMEKDGTSFLIAPYVVMPHGRPEDGVTNNSLSVLFTKEPFFLENSDAPIKLVIVVAATDSKSHLQILQKVSNRLLDKTKFQNLLSSECESTFFTNWTDATKTKGEAKWNLNLEKN